MRLRLLCFLVMSAILSGPAPAQGDLYFAEGVEPPKVPLWRLEPNGNAVQTDMGFIFPAKWKTYVREKFTATRSDGASVKVWYRSPDKEMSLAILLNIRIDIRGIDLGPDFPWQLISGSADMEMGTTTSKPTILSSGSFSLGGRQPPGRTRWARYELAAGPKIQGLWWQNIGIWSVVITAAGPEARGAEIEEAAATLLEEMPFPSGTLTSELRASGTRLFAAMPACDGNAKDGNGAGRPKPAAMEERAALALFMTAYLKPQLSPMHPATSGQTYCVLERFKAHDTTITAIRYMGQPGKHWDARYGFALDDGRRGYLQFDRLREWPNGVPPVVLSYANYKEVRAVALFTDWPSYADAKEAVINSSPRNPYLVAVSNPAEQVSVNVNTNLDEAAAKK